MKKIVISLTIMIVILLGYGTTSHAAGFLWIYSVYDGSSIYDTLNCYTSGNVVSGTQVSLWSLTGNDSQLWEYQKESNGRYSLRSLNNTSVAINAYRGYIGSTVNVLTAEGNNINDYTFIMRPTEGVISPFIMDKRGAHTAVVAITSHGANALCTWEYWSSSLDSQQYFGAGIYGA